jgi:aspartate racemase
MPSIRSPGGPLSWPQSEGTLGVIGVAPWATIEFCRAFYGQIRAEKDWNYPRVLLDINTKLPSRGRHLQLGETDPSESIAATIKELADQGATLAVVVCNTAHILFERWSVGSPIPILHIVDETVELARRSGATRVAPLVSESLSKHDLYGQRAALSGLDCFRLGHEDQQIVNTLIEEIKKSGFLNSATRRSADELLARLRDAGVDTVIAGCTELSRLADPCSSSGLGLVDSNVALARAALLRLAIPASLLAFT